MKLLALTAIAGIALTGGTAIAATTLTASSDVVVTATVKHHPDNGHGTPSHWAADSFTRTMVIHKTGAGYTITTTDKGTFTTVKGAGSPSGAAGTQIARTLTGAFASADTGHVTGGALVANPGNLSGKVYDDTAAGGTPFPGSGAWANQFFAAGSTVSPFDHYAFSYTTADEKWIDADTNNDGQAPAAGNITGKLSSRLVALNKCRLSKADPRNRWVVKNVRGDRKSAFTYRVSYHGTWSKAGTGAVAAGGSTTITTGTGGYLSVHYHNGYGVVVYTSARSKPSVLC